MKLIKYYIFLGLIVILSSCDSREDVIKNNNSAPVVTIVSGADVSNDSANEVTVKLRHGEQRTVFFTSSDEYFGEDKKVNIVRVDLEGDVSYVDIDMYEAEGKIVITDTKEMSDILEGERSMDLKIEVSDYFGDKGVATIHIVSLNNTAPTPDFKYSKIGGFEYLVDASASYDKDGDEIAAFEYLFDGRYSPDIWGYEDKNTDSNSEFKLKAGLAAKGGTYIIATKLTEVKHAFQSSGSHIIAVRVKDSFGCWSKWKEQVVYVE